MKFLQLLIILPYLTGCFFGPVEELIEQVNDTYFIEEFSEEPNPLTNINNYLNFNLVWESNIGDHDGSEFQFVLEDNFVVAATSDGTIKKINISNGNTVWEKEINATIMSGIGGDLKRLVFVSEDGYLWCLNENGDAIWKTYIDGEVYVPPEIFEGKIYVRVGNYEILQVELLQGNINWKFKKPGPALTFKGTSPVSYDRELIYAGFPSSKLIAIHADSGAYVWERTISEIKGNSEIERLNDILSKAYISGPVIYAISTNGDIAAINRQSGNILWTRMLSSSLDLNSDGYDVFVVHKSGSIYSLDKTNGVTKWRQADLRNRRLTRAAIVQDNIVVADFEGYFHFLDITDGMIRGRIQMPGNVPIQNNFKVINDSEVIGMDQNGNIFYFRINESIAKVKNSEPKKPTLSKDTKKYKGGELSDDSESFWEFGWWDSDDEVTDIRDKSNKARKRRNKEDN
jgi:outer membrane protein assembly factor BamB